MWFSGAAAAASPSAPSVNLFFVPGGSVNEVAASAIASSAVGTGWNEPQALAVDASGDLFVDDLGLTNQIQELPALAGGGFGTPVTVASGFSFPTGVAVDGTGDVFVSDNAGVVYEIPAGHYGQALSSDTVVASGLQSLYGVAADTAGDVYFTAQLATNSYVALEVPAGLYGQALGSDTLVASALAAPAGLAVDTAGDVYIADDGSPSGDVIEVAAGAYGAAASTYPQIGTGLTFPTSVTIDPAGDVFIAHQGYIEEEPAGGGAQIDIAGPSLESAVATAPAASVLAAPGGVGSVAISEPQGFSLASSSDTTLAAASLPNTGLPTTGLPDGVVSFDLTGGAPNTSYQVTLTLPVAASSYYKYDSGSQTWNAFSGAVFSDGGLQVTLTLTSDSSGTIIDPGAPAGDLQALLPEAPISALLPIVGVAVMGAAIGLKRRRRRAGWHLA